MRIAIIMVIALGVGCIHREWPGNETLTKRGSYDLKCPASYVTVTNIGGTSYEVSGCEGVRVYTCTTDGRTCVADGNRLPPETPLPPFVPQAPPRSPAGRPFTPQR